MVIPTQPEVFLDRLAAFSHQWRESALPPSLRAAGIFGFQVTVRGAVFELQRESSRREPILVCRGTVTAAGRETLVRASIVESRRFRLLTRAWALLVPAILAVVVLGGEGSLRQVLTIGGFFAVFAFGALALSFRFGAERASPQFRLILAWIASGVGGPVA